MDIFSRSTLAGGLEKFFQLGPKSLSVILVKYVNNGKSSLKKS
jgi:hypothetical protein